MRLLITGITGFVGSHMAEYALAHGAEVFGSIKYSRSTENIEHLRSQIKLIECDLRDLASVRGLLETAEPTHVVHLAAQSFVGASWQTPAETLSTNIISQVNLLEGIRRFTVAPRFLVVGTSEEYGLVHPDELPIRETNPFRPLSPYAVSKVAQDVMGYQYFMSYGLPIIRARAFNHEGPRRGEVFVTSNFAKQIALIEAGKQKPVLEVGNLEARRDWHDVRDTVRAYWKAAFEGEPGDVYNIGRGEALSIQGMLDLLLSMAKVDVEVRPVPERMRPSDVELLLCDPTKFHARTGWEPTIPLDQTLRDTLEYWRERVS